MNPPSSCFRPIRLLLLLPLLLFPLLLSAQLTYERALGDGQAQYKALDYEDAIKKFEAAKLLSKGKEQQTEVNDWLDRAKDGRLNALKHALEKADSALAVANRVLNQMYFYQGKFGLTLKEVSDQNYKYGFIDRNGEEVIPFEFEEATPFSTGDGFARVKKSGKKYLLDTTGVSYLLAESLEELKPETEALDLHLRRPDSLPYGIGRYGQLQVILADGSFPQKGRLKELPSSIGQLTNLTVLSFRLNRLSSLPPQLGQLQHLQTLNLYRNELRTLPPEIGQLQNLQELNLSDNNFESLPTQFGNLQKLQILVLRSNQFTNLPSEVRKLENLQELDLRNNRLTRFPSEVGKLKKLQTLNLSYTQLHSLPPEIRELQNLQTLSLDDNQLSSLPPEFGQLQNLQTLSLENNQLHSLPLEFGQLHNLQTLSLADNQLLSLPPEFGQLQNLHICSFYNNQLHSLPPEFGQLQNLQKLDLRNNRLSILPPEFGQMQNIETLYLDHNQLISLPLEFGQLENLQTLRLDDNQLISLPPEFGQLGKLHTLSLNDNQLSSLPLKLNQLYNLEILYFSGNQLSNLPLEMEQLQNLQTLTLSYNPLSEAQIENLRVVLPGCRVLYQSQTERLANAQKGYKSNQKRVQQACAKIEAQLTTSQPIDSTEASNQYNSLGWNSLLLGKFEAAEVAIRRGLELDSTNLYLYTNLAPILLFQGKGEEARKMYQQWVSEPYMPPEKPSFREAFLVDFVTFEEAKIVPEAYRQEVEEIMQLLQKKEVGEQDSDGNDE